MWQSSPPQVIVLENELMGSVVALNNLKLQEYTLEVHLKRNIADLGTIEELRICEYRIIEGI